MAGHAFTMDSQADTVGWSGDDHFIKIFFGIVEEVGYEKLGVVRAMVVIRDAQ